MSGKASSGLAVTALVFACGTTAAASAISAQVGARHHRAVTKAKTVPPSTTVPASSTTTSTTSLAPPGEGILKVAFFNAGQGYALFEEQGQSSCALDVASTRDGGARFAVREQVAPFVCPAGPPASSLVFDDLGDGFVFGPDLFITHDGGATWTRSSSFGDVVSVEPMGRSIWMLEGSCSFTEATPPCSFSIQESADGGRTWSGDQLPGSGTPRAYADLLRIAPSSAFLVAENVGEQPTDSVDLLVTSDGGTTWRTRSSPPCIGTNWGAYLSEAPDGVLWLACAGEPGAGQEVKNFARSLDGGKTWLQGPCAIPPGATTLPECFISPSPISSGYLGDIAATSATTAFIDGGRNVVQVTHDGGVSWELTSANIGDDGDLGTGGLFFANREDGWFIEGQGNTTGSELWRTTDGGDTWAHVWPLLRPQG